MEALKIERKKRLWNFSHFFSIFFVSILKASLRRKYNWKTKWKFSMRTLLIWQVVNLPGYDEVRREVSSDLWPPVKPHYLRQLRLSRDDLRSCPVSHTQQPRRTFMNRMTPCDVITWLAWWREPWGWRWRGRPCRPGSPWTCCCCCCCCCCEPPQGWSCHTAVSACWGRSRWESEGSRTTPPLDCNWWRKTNK